MKQNTVSSLPGFNAKRSTFYPAPKSTLEWPKYVNETNSARWGAKTSRVIGTIDFDFRIYTDKKRGRASYAGSLLFSFSEFAAMIGITNSSQGLENRLFARKFNADCCAQGVFYRRANEVCIPGPSTGEDGDSVLSVNMTDAIRKTLAEIPAFKAWLREQQYVS